MDVKATAPMHILMAMDGSEHALAGVQALKDLHLSPGSQVTVMTVFSPRNAAYLPEYERYNKQAVDMLADAPFDVHAEVVAGVEAETLANFASQSKVDLIVMGAKGRRATRSIMLGGVAQQVVEYAARPALIVRAPYKGFHRIMLATDGSSCSDSAVDYLGAFPLAVDARLGVVHVLPPPPLPQSVLIGQAWPVSYEMAEVWQSQQSAEVENILKEEERLGKDLLERTLARLAERLPGHSIHSTLRRGDAATEMLEYIEKNEIDLVVAGSRGLSPVTGWLLGSVSRKLIHYTACSVLIVRGQFGCPA